jgi:hypothetical protein
MKLSLRFENLKKMPPMGHGSMGKKNVFYE